MLYYGLRDNPREIYRINLTDAGLDVVISRSLHLTALKEIKNEQLLGIFEKGVLSSKEETTTYQFPFPYISFPNYSHKNINWEGVRHVATLLGLFLQYLNMFLERAGQFALSEQPQLIAIECWCGLEWSSINVGFSPQGITSLSSNWKDGGLLPETQQEMTVAYEKLSAKNKKAFLRNTRPSISRFMSTSAGIRQGGTPTFTVLGNCACLGSNPDYFLKGECDLEPHNIDTPLQLLTMVVGVVHFWDKVLRPTYNRGNI